MQRKIGAFVLALFAAVATIEVGDSLLATGAPSIARQAEAIVGRPLTPVSVAGVARRTTRRCAVGVYYC